MPIELLESIKGGSRSYGAMDEDPIILTIKLEDDKNGVHSFLTFRCPKNTTFRDIINSIDHQLNDPSLSSKKKDGKRTYFKQNSTLGMYGVKTGAKLVLRDSDPSRFDLNVIEVRVDKNFQEHDISIHVSPDGPKASEILSRLESGETESKVKVKFATGGDLVFKKVKLHNAPLWNLGIKDGDILHFHPKSIKFKLQIPALKGIEAFETKLEAFLSERILDFKATTLKTLLPKNISDPSQYRLVDHQNSRLVEARWFGELKNVIDGSVLRLETVSNAAVLLNLQTESGSEFVLRIEPSVSVSEVKKETCRKKDYPVSHQVLKFGKFELEDDLPLSAYNIGSGSKLNIILRSYYLTIVDAHSNKEYWVKVKASDTISIVKEKLSACLSIGSAQHYTLKLEQEVPSDSSILCEMKVLENGKLKLFINEGFRRAFSSLVNLIIQPDTVNVTAFTIRVSKDSFVRSLLEKISLTKKIAVSSLHLFKDGMRMNPDDLLRGYNVEENTVIDLCIDRNF